MTVVGVPQCMDLDKQQSSVGTLAYLQQLLALETGPDDSKEDSLAGHMSAKPKPRTGTPTSERAKKYKEVQPTTINEAVAIFGQRTTAAFSTAVVGTPEEQLKWPVRGLIRDVGGVIDNSWWTGLEVVPETPLADHKVRPDLATLLNGQLVGFIELKAPGKGANPLRFSGHDKAQWERLRALPNLIYTDGFEFTLWQDGELVVSTKFDDDPSAVGASLKAPSTLSNLFEQFLRWRPISPRSAKELARTTARMCRLLREEVVGQLAAGSPGFKTLIATWRKALFAEASDNEFADGYAQAVTFGMLMARAQGTSLENLDLAAQGLGDTLIGAALRVLTFTRRNEKPMAMLKTLQRVLDAVNWDLVASDGPDTWLYFYEDFLAEYDGDLRKQTGSYYTPPQVVTEMVRLVNDVLQTRFALPEGLSSKAVTIADPAAGTGTFLLAALRHISAVVEESQGPGAVPAAVEEAAARMIGFDIQLGPFAVAQIRLMAEFRELIGADPAVPPRMYIADTLANPYVAEEVLSPFLEPITESRNEANRIKKDERIMVVLGNPPYKDRAQSSGGWITQGDQAKEGPLKDWIPPKSWKQGTQVRHLHNLYVYFWRWATWKVFDQYPAADNGIVCFVSSAAFLNGTAFEKMRQYLRETADEIWVIDCSPEGHQPDVSTRFFGGVQQPICIVLACRAIKTKHEKPALVRFRQLAAGHRDTKFAALAEVTLEDAGWETCPSDWRAPFRPQASGAWATYPSLSDLFIYNGNGTMIARTWPVAPDEESLRKRWLALHQASRSSQAELFQTPSGNGKPVDRHIDKVPSTGLPNFELRHSSVRSDKGACVTPVRYAFRSFDRQYIIPDVRLINRPNPALWAGYSGEQIYITAPMDRAPTCGPAVTVTGAVPDAHHYNGRGGRVFMMWQDSEAQVSNVSSQVLTVLTSRLRRRVETEDVLAYVVAITSHSGFIERFKKDLSIPGIRVPITSNPDLFADAVNLGRQVIWLQTFGERFCDKAAGRPNAVPRVDSPPRIPVGGTIAGIDGALPDEISYDVSRRRLNVGTGYIDNVAPEVWSYQVSDTPVVKQWFSYRRQNRDRPKMGRAGSNLSNIGPSKWPAEYTTELLALIAVLTRLIELEPRQADLLARICNGRTISLELLSGPSAPKKTRRATKVIPEQAVLPFKKR